jgi:hypothetical protein
MRKRSQAAVAEIDRQFLTWILFGLVAATVGSGSIALAMALRLANLQ